MPCDSLRAAATSSPGSSGQGRPVANTATLTCSGRSDGRVALYLRSDAARLIREPEEPPTGEIHGRLREHLQGRGASFFRDLYYATGSGDEDAVLDALWDMVWAGEVTNDTFLPLRM